MPGASISELAGLVVCGSPGWNPGAPFGRLLARVLGARSGGRARSRFLKVLTFGPFYRAFKKEQSKCAWICSDRAVVAAYEADPLCGFTFTCNGFASLYTLMEQCYDKACEGGQTVPAHPLHLRRGGRLPRRGQGLCAGRGA